MSRSLTAQMIAAADGEVIRDFNLLELQFSTSTVRLWNGFGDLQWNNETWTGAGNLLGISQIQESTGVEALGIRVELSGVNQAIVTLAVNEDYQGRPATLYLGQFDEDGDIIPDPVPIFGGYMDVMTIESAGEASTISIAIENKMIAFERPYVRRYTDEDQKIEHPTDKGFEFVAAIQDLELVWGRSK